MYAEIRECRTTVSRYQPRIEDGLARSERFVSTLARSDPAELTPSEFGRFDTPKVQRYLMHKALGFSRLRPFTSELRCRSSFDAPTSIRVSSFE
jgi:hypothetical protein